MSKTIPTPRVTRADIAYVKTRLLRDYAESYVTEAIETVTNRGSLRIYDDAMKVIEQRIQEEEAAAREQRAEEERFLTQQAILSLKYDALVRPALARWMGLRDIDPLCNPADLAALYVFAQSAGYDVHGRKMWQEDGDIFYCTLTQSKADGYTLGGQGEGDTPAEALVLACYQIALKEGER